MYICAGCASLALTRVHADPARCRFHTEPRGADTFHPSVAGASLFFSSWERSEREVEIRTIGGYNMLLFMYTTLLFFIFTTFVFRAPLLTSAAFNCTESSGTIF